jgi:FKBP-type peptidyl-prolyl cis-trans isomerase (trigger factor)
MLTRVIAIVAAVAITVSPMVACSDNFDYLTSDLSEYLTISAEDYKNYEADLSKIKDVTDEDVQFEIYKVLASKKDTVPLDNGTGYKGAVAKNGDVVYINYYGYKLDDEGRKIILTQGMSNMLSAPSSLALGSGQMVSGFEYGIIGKSATNYAKLVKRTSGTIANDDVIFVTYTAAYPDGTTKSSVTERIDLSKPVDDLYGEGFKDFIVGKSIGKITFTAADGSASNSGVFKYNNKGDVAYTSMTVNFASDGEKNATPLTVDAYFSNDYHTVELRGERCKFDVYIDYVVKFDTPTLTDEFVKDTLKLEDTVKDYEGETLADKYTAYVRDNLEKTVKDAKDDIREDAMWDAFVDKATFYKLPKSKVDKQYNELYAQLKATYEANADAYASYYGIKSFDAYVRAASGSTDATAKAEDLIRGTAQTTVKELLVFYYIIRNENMVLDEARYSEVYENVLKTYIEEYAKQNSISRDNYATDEAYENAMRAARYDVIAILGEETMQHNVYFDACVDTMISWAKPKAAQ